MSFTLVNTVIPALVARLKANLPDDVDALNSMLDEPELGADMVHVENILDYVPAPNLIYEFPTVAVTEMASAVEDDEGGAFGTVNPFSIVVFYQHVEQRNLVWGLRIYTAAIMSALTREDSSTVPSRTLGGGNVAWGFTLGGVVPGPTRANRESPRTYLSLSAVPLEVRRDEW